MIPLDLFVYSNEHFNTNLSWELKGRKIPPTLGIEARFEILPEELLPEGKREDGTPLPQEAVVSVHGNAMQGYGNISHIRRLSQQRPDLRFIISIDTRYRKEAYKNPSDYDYARQLLEERFTPLKPVTATNHHPGAFLSGVSAGIMPVTRSFEKYLGLWKMVKEGHVFSLVTYSDHSVELGREKAEEIAEELGILYQGLEVGEYHLHKGELETREPIPPNAIVLVHGNFMEKYSNITEVRRLAQMRPDLHWIITVDTTCLDRMRFQDQKDYDLVREALEEDFSAAQKIAVTTANPLGFMRGNNVGEPIDCSLENYMKSWKQLRGL